jgi:hypothetical protein
VDGTLIEASGQHEELSPEGMEWRAAGAGIKLGPRVCGLAAGGKRIRTAGPTLKETSRSELAMRVSARGGTGCD